MAIQSLKVSYFQNPTLSSIICAFICNPTSGKEWFFLPTPSPAFTAIRLLDGSHSWWSHPAVPVAYLSHIHWMATLVSGLCLSVSSLKECLPSFSIGSALWSQTPLFWSHHGMLSFLHQLQIGCEELRGLTAVVSQNLTCIISLLLCFECFCWEVSCYSDWPAFCCSAYLAEHDMMWGVFWPCLFDIP